MKKFYKICKITLIGFVFLLTGKERRGGRTTEHQDDSSKLAARDKTNETENNNKSIKRSGTKQDERGKVAGVE